MTTLVLTIVSVVLSGFQEQDDAMEPMVVRLQSLNRWILSSKPKFRTICSKVLVQWMCDRARCDMAVAVGFWTDGQLVDLGEAGSHSLRLVLLRFSLDVPARFVFVDTLEGKIRHGWFSFFFHSTALGLRDLSPRAAPGGDRGGNGRWIHMSCRGRRMGPPAGLLFGRGS